MKQSIHLRIQCSDKMEDISCTTENRCRKSSSREFRRKSRFNSYSSQEAMRFKIAHTTLEKTFEKRDTLNQDVVWIVKERALPGASNVSSTRLERSSLPPRSSRHGDAG